MIIISSIEVLIVMLLLHFPKEETTRLTLRAEKPRHTTIYLRYPSWSKNVKVLVNGKKVSVKQKPGSYIAITREWKDGDRIAA